MENFAHGREFDFIVYQVADFPFLWGFSSARRP